VKCRVNEYSVYSYLPCYHVPSGLSLRIIGLSQKYPITGIEYVNEPAGVMHMNLLLLFVAVLLDLNDGKEAIWALYESALGVGVDVKDLLVGGREW
jgi:hypothetical protein